MPKPPADTRTVRQLRARIAELEAELGEARGAPDAPGGVEAHFRQVLDSLPDGVVVHQDGKVAFANAAAARLIGAESPDDVIGKPSLSSVPPEYREAQQRRRQKVLTERCSLPLIEQQRQRLDGSPVWVETAATFVMWEGKPAFLGVLRDITGRKQAEAALRQGEEQYRNLLESMPDGVIIHVDRRIVFANQAAVRIFGATSKEQLIGTNPLDMIPEAYHQNQAARRDLILNQRCLAPLAEQKRRRFDGSEIWVENVGAFTLWQGQPAIIGLLRDISEKKAAQEHASQLYNWLRGAVASMPEGFMLWDAQDRLVLFNQQILKFYPRPERLVEGASFDELITGTADAMRRRLGDQAADRWLETRRRQRREARGEYEFAGADGTYFVVAERRTPEGFTVTLVADVTGHRQSENRLREGEARYRALIDLSPDAIYVHKNGRIVLCNEAAVRMFGATGSDELLGRHTLELVDPEFRELVSDYQHRAAAAGTRTAYMRQRRLKIDGTAFWAEVAAAAVDWEGERGGIVVVRDISGQMRAEEMLRRSKETAELANRAKTQFLANVSHELRTPLNAIIGFSDLMNREMLGPVGNEQYAAYVRDIYQSGTHLHEMINDILDLSKVEAGKAELREDYVDVVGTVDRCLRLLRPRADSAEVTLETRFDDALPRLYADARKIKQVLINLLSNAVKFTPPGGRVTVSAGCDDKGGMSIAVSDTGIGMKPEDIPIALQPFGQLDSSLDRKYEGTGLGLPLSKSLVELHGGTFEIESAPGKGTRIIMRFPHERVIAQSSAAE